MYLTESKIVYLSNIKEEKMNYEKIVQDLDLQSENIHDKVHLFEGKKRMRLHQLSWEEKIQRKKLRNRIAAQTSRDRKKAKMDYLEDSVKELRLQNEILLMQVEELKKKNDILVDANTELQKALAERPYTCSCLRKIKEEEVENKVVDLSNDVVDQICVEDGYSFERPAESSEIPQQKGQIPTLAQVLTKTSWSLLNIFLLYLLSQKCWQISREMHSLMTLKAWHQVCWKKLNNMRAEETQHFYSERSVLLVSNTEHLEGGDLLMSPFQVSGTGREKCTYNTEVVGETPKELEPSRSEVNIKFRRQQNCFQAAKLTNKERIWLILSEHSYALPEGLSFPEVLKTKLNSSDFNVPTIKISESDKISAIENELKKGIEPDSLSNDFIVSPFQNFHSPRSESLSDQGYESAASPYESEIPKMDFNDINELWRDSFSELFPELL